MKTPQCKPLHRRGVGPCGQKFHTNVNPITHLSDGLKSMPYFSWLNVCVYNYSGTSFVRPTLLHQKIGLSEINTSRPFQLGVLSKGVPLYIKVV